MKDVKIYDCHNCISIFNTDEWVRHDDYKKLESQNTQLIECLEFVKNFADRKIINHIDSVLTNDNQKT